MKNKDIEELLNELKWYADAPNEQDYNGEYDPPLEWEQGDVKLLLSYIEQLEQCYCNRTDCSSRIKDSKKYDSLLQKYKQLENNRDKAIEIIKKDWYKLNSRNIDEISDTKTDIRISLYNILKGDSE